MRFKSLLILTALIGCHDASGNDPAEREWRLVTSQNFRMHSVLSEERTIELLRHLEVMRAALDDPTAPPTYQSNVPTVIVALDNRDDYWRVGAPVDTVGFFIANARENAIFIQDTKRSGGIQIILHEYVHYLNRKNGRVPLPRWFEEGRAEYLSQSRINGNQFEYGLPARDRLLSLKFGNWLPGEELVALVDTDSLDEADGDLFYGQSWLLVHYLHSRATESDDVMEQIAVYSEQLADGTDKIEAFEQAFDLDTTTLNEVLTEYLLAGEFQSESVTVDTTLPGFSPQITSLSAAEARLALGKMAMRFENDTEAETWFQGALADDVTRPHAEAGLGTVEGYRGDIAAAEARFESAIFLVSYDFNIWMDYAQFWARRVSESRNLKERLFLANRLEESLRNALTISDATPELNSLMGFAYLARGEKIDRAIEHLEAAIGDSPIDQGSRILLANAYVLADRYDQAIATAETILRYEHESNEITAAARRIIAEAKTQMN